MCKLFSNEKKWLQERSLGTFVRTFFMIILSICTLRFFSFNLEFICTLSFSKSLNCIRRSDSCLVQLQLSENSLLVQINSKLNEKRLMIHAQLRFLEGCSYWQEYLLRGVIKYERRRPEPLSPTPDNWPKTSGDISNRKTFS